MEIRYLDPGRVSYKEGLNIQNAIHKSLVESKKNKESHTGLNQTLILCEHTPVYTLGKSGKLDNLLYSEDELETEGIEYFDSNRGGDITYHGPGQIVGYPIIDMDFFYHDVHRYVRDIEEVIIRSLSELAIESFRVEGLTGVWVNGEIEGNINKICAIGIHMSRWVTLHGFALNVNTDLKYFKGIIPCGISESNKSVTSISKELGRNINILEVKEIIIKKFDEVFNVEIIK
jgi:lipoyl(octanoyl) transferase